MKYFENWLRSTFLKNYSKMNHVIRLKIARILFSGDNILTKREICTYFSLAIRSYLNFSSEKLSTLKWSKRNFKCNQFTYNQNLLKYYWIQSYNENSLFYPNVLGLPIPRTNIRSKRMDLFYCYTSPSRRGSINGINY